MAPSASKSTEGRAGGSDDEFDLGDSPHVDYATFEQILEMDDDEDDREFSRSIVYDFFQQAETTFQKMEAALDQRNLTELSGLGHFLKGSSATLGLNKLRDSCEKIQHYGAGKDETGQVDMDEDRCLKHLTRTVEQAKVEFFMAERALRRFYRDDE